MGKAPQIQSPSWPGHPSCSTQDPLLESLQCLCNERLVCPLPGSFLSVPRLGFRGAGPGQWERLVTVASQHWHESVSGDWGCSPGLVRAWAQDRRGDDRTGRLLQPVTGHCIRLPGTSRPSSATRVGLGMEGQGLSLKLPGCGGWSKGRLNTHGFCFASWFFPRLTPRPAIL